jgi:hypothetical protein
VRNTSPTVQEETSLGKQLQLHIIDVVVRSRFNNDLDEQLAMAGTVGLETLKVFPIECIMEG